MQKPTYLTLFLLAASVMLRAQNTEEVNIIEVINRLFTGMHKADSTMIHAAFDKEVMMATAFRNKGGNRYSGENIRLMIL